MCPVVLDTGIELTNLFRNRKYLLFIYLLFFHSSNGGLDCQIELLLLLCLTLEVLLRFSKKNMYVDVEFRGWTILKRYVLFSLANLFPVFMVFNSAFLQTLCSLYLYKYARLCKPSLTQSNHSLKIYCLSLTHIYFFATTWMVLGIK